MERMPDITGISHVSLSVRDLEASELWYRELFGLELLFQEHQPRYDAVVLVHLATDTIIELQQHRIGPTARFDETRTGLDHLALGVADRASLGDWERKLTEAGIDHSPVTEVEHGAVVTFRDPDHIRLELFCLETPAERSKGRRFVVDTGVPVARAIRA